MEYSIVGNKNYLITDKKEIKRIDGKPNWLKIKNGKITIDIYGYIKTIEIEWLYWLSYFKLEMPNGYEERVFDIEFKDIFSLKHMRVDPKMVIFKKPVYIKEDDNFRLIARFPNYAISTAGVVHNMKTGIYNKPRSYYRNGVLDYRKSTAVDQANLYSSDEQLTHRLVAITWVPNDDYKKYYLVDHKDGDKTNCHYTNLRWVDHIGNNKAKVYQGLSSQAIAVTIRDIDTGLTKSFPSLGTACEYMGRTRIDTKTTPLKPNRIWETPKGRFEIKYSNNTHGWYYSDKTNTNNVNQKVEVTITKETGETIILKSLNDFITKVFEGKKSADSINKAVSVYRKRYPNDKIVVKILDNYSEDVNYIAKNIVNDNILISSSRKELSELTNVTKSSVQKSIANDGAYQFDNWVFKVDDHKPFRNIINKEHYNKPKQISILDTTSNNSRIFDSIRKTSDYLNIDKKTIKKFLNSNNLLFNKYLLTESA